MRTMNLAAAILERGTVRLEPFEEHHRAALAAVAGAEPDIFRHIPFPVATQGYSAWFDYLRADQSAGRSIPHAVFRNVTGEIVFAARPFAKPPAFIAVAITPGTVTPGWSR